MSIRHWYTPDSLDLKDARRLYHDAVMRLPTDQRKRAVLHSDFLVGMKLVKKMENPTRGSERPHMGKPQSAGRGKQ